MVIIQGPQQVEMTDRRNLLHKEPSVINDEMITEALEKLLPKGEAGKFARSVPIDPRRVTHLLIEYQTISQIANISHMTNLKRLQLCNNVISKIEKLDTLINLQELDLSFNNIRKIEGLDKLKKLKILNLHRNFITTFENMNHLLRLEMLFVSSNGLGSYENTKYLRQFTSLSSVTFRGNPMCKDQHFRPFLISHVPQIKYIDYHFVSPKEREQAATTYQTKVEKLAEEEDKLRRRASVVDAEENVKELYKKAFVDGFDEDAMWHALYERDQEGKALLQLSDTEDLQIMYRELFRRASRDLFEKGMLTYVNRENEFKAYNSAVKDDKTLVQEEGIKLTEEFVEVGREFMRGMVGYVNVVEDLERRKANTEKDDFPPNYYEVKEALGPIAKDYVKALHNVWYTLMANEMELNEQIQEINQEVERSIRDIVLTWLEQLRGHFGALREIQMQLNERLVETLVTYGEFRFSDTEIPSALKDLVHDKESLAIVIQASHEHHVQVIDGKEEQMVKNWKTWIEHATGELRKRETHRNRARIAEISHFVDENYKNLVDAHVLNHVTIPIPDVRDDQEHTEADGPGPREGRSTPLLEKREKEKQVRKMRKKSYKKKQRKSSTGVQRN